MLRRQRLEKLLKSNDEAIRWVATTPGFDMHIQRCKRMAQGIHGEVLNTNQSQTEMAALLHRSCDGRGLWQASSYPWINGWVTDGTMLLTGADYIQAVHVRGNLLPTTERTNRGRRDKVQSCEAGCNAANTLAHISQSCVLNPSA